MRERQNERWGQYGGKETERCTEIERKLNRYNSILVIRLKAQHGLHLRTSEGCVSYCEFDLIDQVIIFCIRQEQNQTVINHTAILCS